MEKAKRVFYVGLTERNGEVTGHVVSQTEPKRGVESASLTDDRAKTGASVPARQGQGSQNFTGALDSFTSLMETYREYMPLLMQMAPAFVSALGSLTVAKMAKQRGKLREDLKIDEMTFYELEMDVYREFAIQEEKVIAGINGSKHLPEIMIIGLVSVYDAFLANLLRVVFNLHSEIVLTSEKTIKFSDLVTYSSIEAARDAIIDTEVEGVIRLSHHEQFDWMEKKFQMKLRDNLPVWPQFVELCERRNLITHTGGVVSPQYIKNCKSHGVSLEGVTVGDRLVTNREYYGRAVRIVYEIGVKLGHVMWRKFQRSDQDKADATLNEKAYELIVHREYELAEKLLSFGTMTVKNHPSDKTRRMMVINHANSFRLMGKLDEANKIISKEDWSATSPDFGVCVAAVSGNLEQLVLRMKELGSSGPITMEDYRTWPVFRNYRTQAAFVDAFFDIFGVALVLPSPGSATPDDPELTPPTSGGTVH